MMLNGVDPNRLGQIATVVFVTPLLLVPIFNFGLRMQLNLVHAPSSRRVVIALFAASLLTILLWRTGSVATAYAVIYSSLWSQVVLLRLLARRYFESSGIYPGQVAFWYWGAENNPRLSWRNRRYALLLMIVGFAELGVLAAVM